MNESLKDWGVLAYHYTLLRLKGAMNSSCKKDQNVTRDSVIQDAKTLCSEYIDDRLIRSGLNLKQRKITPASSFTRDEDMVSRSMNLSTKSSERQVSSEAIQILTEKRYASGGCALTIDDLSKVLLYIGEVLEFRHASVYTDVLQQLNIRSLGEVNLRRVYMNVGKEIFAKGVDWAKVVSLFAFAGALAVDCVLCGSSVYIPRIKNWSVEYVENELTDWIVEQGGWIGLFDYFTAQQKTSRTSSYFIWTLSAVVLLVSVVLAATLVINFRTP